MLQNSLVNKIDNIYDKIFELPIPINEVIGNEKVSLKIKEIIEDNKNKEIFFFFGRLVKYKGVEVLLNSFSYIQNNKVILIAGEGSLSAQVKENSKKYNNIFFIERFLNENEKRFLFKNATAFLFPSINVSETLGITQIEALSLGCPVINTNLKTAVPYVSIDELTGKTIKLNDNIELSNAINNFPEKNTINWKKLSTNAKKRYKKHFSRKIFEKKFLDIISKII